MTKKSLKLLRELQDIFAPAGEEDEMRDAILNYVTQHSPKWKTIPVIYSGKGFQNAVILVFGDPKTAVYAHMDSIGYTVGYNNEILKLGGPVLEEGIRVWGKSQGKKVKGKLYKKGDSWYVKSKQEMPPGTNLVFTPQWKETEDYVQNCYMDNRLGVWNALQLAKTMKDGALVFSTWEETGGGSVGYLGKFLYEKYGVDQALISDITWVTKGVKAGNGVAISQRDSGIPRRSYVEHIMRLAAKSSVDFQIEVESAGGSDGNQLQRSSYPIDWCFIGAPEQNVHSPKEKVHKKDIDAMLALYKYLMKKMN